MELYVNNTTRTLYEVQFLGEEDDFDVLMKPVGAGFDGIVLKAKKEDFDADFHEYAGNIIDIETYKRRITDG